MFSAGPAPAEEPLLEVPEGAIGPAISSRQAELFPLRSDWRWYELSTHWLFRDGDDLEWADSELPDGQWTRLDSTGTLLRAAVRADTGWDGLGWFRLHLRLPAPLLRQSLSLLWTQRGASEIYLDGRLVRSLGTVGTTPGTEECLRIDPDWPEVIPVHLGSRSDHVIAVRYSNQRNLARPGWLADLEHDVPGFVARLVESSVGIDYAARSARLSMLHQMLFVVPLAFGVLHLFIFLFDRAQKGNLYYAAFAASLALLILGPFSAGVASDPDRHWFYVQVSKAASVLTLLFSLRFLHHEILDRPPRYFRWLAGVCTLVLTFCWLIPLEVVYVFYALALFPEVIRVTYLGIRNHVPGARIIALGWLLFIVGCGYQLLRELDIIEARRLFIPYLYGTVALVVAMSVHLARNVAHANRELAAQLIQVRELSQKALAQERRARAEEIARKELEAESARKSVELEAAHKRQKLAEELEETNLELRETQGHLVESAKMAALGNLVAGVTHEMNSPLGALTSALNTLDRAAKRLRGKLTAEHVDELGGDSTVSRLVDAIASSVRVMTDASDRVAGIVRNLRSFARLDEADRQVANLEHGLDSTVAVMRSQIPHGISVRKAYQGISPVECSPGQLNQVFMHLIRNAIQAMGEEGEIMLETSQDEDNVYVRVRDTGPGIPPEQLEHIFDFRFRAGDSRVKMGLGLVADYNIVQAQNGALHIESDPGRGTRVTITLPRRA